MTNIYDQQVIDKLELKACLTAVGLKKEQATKKHPPTIPTHQRGTASMPGHRLHQDTGSNKKICSVPLKKQLRW